MWPFSRVCSLEADGGGGPAGGSAIEWYLSEAKCCDVWLGEEASMYIRGGLNAMKCTR